MKKYISLFTLALLALAFSFSACSDDDNAKKDTVPSTPEEIAASKTSEEAMQLMGLLSAVADVDSLPDNWFEAAFTVEPTVGTVLDDAQPYVRSLAVANLKEAVEVYNNLTGQTLDAATTANSWNLEGSGSVSYKAVNQTDVFATIDFSIRQLPHLQQLRLVPAAALGTNATFAGEPYYHLGDVIHDTREDSYWICARPAYSPAGKGDSHWFSFQLTEKNYKTYEGTTKRKTTIVPTKLEKNTRIMNYFMNLLYVMANPDNCADLFQKGNVLENGMGELGAAAYSVSMLQQIANYWHTKDVWKHIPVNPDFFRQQDVNVLYYGYSSPGISNMTIYCMNYSGKGYASANKADYKWDMNKGLAFDAHIYAKNGGIDENKNEVGPSDAIIVRYRKQTDFMKNYKDPTQAMDPSQKTIEDVYRYAATKSQRTFVPGDIIQDNNTGALYFCVQPSGSTCGNPSKQALFLSVDPRAMKFSDDGLTLTNAIEEDYLPRVAFMLYQLTKTLNDLPFLYNETLFHIRNSSGMDPRKFFAVRDSVMNHRATYTGAHIHCTNFIYKRKSDGQMGIMRFVHDSTPCYDPYEYLGDIGNMLFFTKYLAGDKVSINLQDVTDQKKVDMYAKDRWSVLKQIDNVKDTPWRTKAETVSPLNLKSYLWDMENKDFANPKLRGMSNDPVLVMTMELIDDSQPHLPENFKIYKFNVREDYWTEGQNVLEFASRYWQQSKSPTMKFFMDGVQFTPADLNF